MWLREGGIFLPRITQMDTDNFEVVVDMLFYYLRDLWFYGILGYIIGDWWFFICREGVFGAKFGFIELFFEV